MRSTPASATTAVTVRSTGRRRPAPSAARTLAPAANGASTTDMWRVKQTRAGRRGPDRASLRSPRSSSRSRCRSATFVQSDQDRDRVEKRMATTEATTRTRLQELAQRHLWLHFSRMGAYGEAHEIPIIVRGDGCYVWDEHGNRYLDALSALFCVNIGHGRHQVAQAGADQARELGFFTNWSYAHPPAIELAARVAGLAPGDLNRVFFTSGGCEAVGAALTPPRQYHKVRGALSKTKVIAREVAYHGATLGALSATGITPMRTPFEPFTPGGCHVPNTNLYRLGPGYGVENLAESIAERIEFEGPETVSAVILEPVQNAGGCFTPPEGYFQRVREICDRYGVLLISDEVICSWGRLGYYFGAERNGYQPDIITTAKGITSAYAAMGAAIVSDRIAEPFLE